MKEKEKKSNIKKTGTNNKSVSKKGQSTKVSTSKKSVANKVKEEKINKIINEEQIQEKQVNRNINEEIINNKEQILSKKSLAIVIVALCILLSVFIGMKVLNISSREKRLEKFGKDFYENWYYEQLSTNKDERSKLLDKFKDKGLKINIDNLSRVKTYINKNLSVKELNKKEKEHNELFESLYGKDVSEPCDKEKSMVIIYPKSPYGKTDYKIETKLVCGKSNK